MTTLSTARDTIRNGVCSINGKKYAGNVEDITLCDVSIMTEDFRAGGMNSAIVLDMGAELSEFSVSLTCCSEELLALRGTHATIVANMQLQSELSPLVFKQFKVTAYGLITNVKFDNVKYGSLTKLSVVMKKPEFFEEMINNEVKTLIDVKNVIRVIGGIDQLAISRLALEL